MRVSTKKIDRNNQQEEEELPQYTELKIGDKKINETKALE